MTEASAIASLSNALSGLQVSSRKPDLPAFDKSAIEIWIRRVESAYIRAGITRSIEKFAFVESKFAVNEDPAIDKFLFGDPTDANWSAFCEYLKKRYGKTKRQKASAFLEPGQLDGRTPVQYLAKLEQNVEGITLDDLKKEICIRQLPNDVQQLICKATENLTAEETMRYAESFFNPDGTRIHKKPQSVNSIKPVVSNNSNGSNSSNNNNDATSFTAPFIDDESETDVNAVRGRANFGRGRQNGGNFSNNNNNGNYNNSRSKSRGRPSGGNNNSNYNRNNNNNASASRQHDPALCFYHNQFGDRAKKCDFGCAKSRSGNGQSPRQQ